MHTLEYRARADDNAFVVRITVAALTQSLDELAYIEAAESTLAPVHYVELITHDVAGHPDLYRSGSCYGFWNEFNRPSAPCASLKDARQAAHDYWAQAQVPKHPIAWGRFVLLVILGCAGAAIAMASGLMLLEHNRYWFPLAMFGYTVASVIGYAALDLDTTPVQEN